jgi:hypothetical protein
MLTKLGKLLENIRISAKECTGYYELKKHKSWFDKSCSELLEQRKQAKFQWSQDPSKINGINLNNILVRRGTSRHFRNKKGEYLKDKTDVSLHRTVKARTLETWIEE